MSDMNFNRSPGHAKYHDTIYHLNFNPGAEIRSFASTCAQVESKIRTWCLFNKISQGCTVRF